MNIIQALKTEFNELSFTRKTLKKFGITFGGILLLFSFIGALYFHLDVPMSISIVGVLFIILGLGYPQTLLYPYYLWMILAIVLGYFFGKILMFVLFYIFVTPIGLLKRIFTKKIHSDKKSYWVTKEEPLDKENMERQF